ncbi:MAG: Omp28-related outer membrane protein [Bacteroidales bacterium]|nr:Omp28-related outer membrane protein [Bacteroidales bacterium]
MKKLFLSLVLGLSSLTLFAQGPTIVSTEVQTRNVVIEEFTGVNCQYCPVGHDNVSDFAAQYPGRVVPINIHTGGYAAQYKTNYGSAIEGQSNLEGYPAGTLNRQTSGCKTNNITPQGNSWQSTAVSFMNTASPVNVAATADIDVITRVMTIHVEIYYTSDVAQNGNLLNIALLQDNIIGPQIITSGYNAHQKTEDGQYIHMHMLRDMITGQWGDTIAKNNEGSINAGTFISKDYTYTIPQQLGINGDMWDVVLGNINLAVFVTDLSKSGCTSLKGPNIWTGVKVIPNYLNVNTFGANIQSLDAQDVLGCENAVDLYATVRNEGTAITAVDFSYENTTANITENSSVEVDIPTFSSVRVKIGRVSVTPSEVNSFKASITGLNSEEYTSTVAPAITSHTKAEVYHSTGYPTLILKTDTRGSEITWSVYDTEGTVLYTGGPYSNGSVVRDTVVFNNLYDGCFFFSITDANQDGMNNGNGSGNYEIINAQGERMYRSNGKFGAGEVIDFSVDGVGAGLNEANENICQSFVYPNPTSMQATLSVNVNKADKGHITLVDITGRVILDLGERDLVSGENKIDINTSKLSIGSYFIHLRTNNGITVNRLNICR